MFPQLVYVIHSVAQNVLAVRYAPGAEPHEDFA